MTKPTTKIIKLSFQCARCFEDDADKLAWFSGKTLFNESLLCRTCWKDQFNKLSDREKKEWSFYDNKK